MVKILKRLMRRLARGAKGGVGSRFAPKVDLGVPTLTELPPLAEVPPLGEVPPAPAPLVPTSARLVQERYSSVARRLPKALQPGDTIGICSPAGIVNAKALKAGCDLLQAWGYKVVLAPNTMGKWSRFSGTDQERADDLNRLFADPRIDGILCARGGYGAPRILSLLDYDIIRENPKWFGGFSDITALHLALDRQAGLVTFHSPMGEVYGGEMPAFNQTWLKRAFGSSEPLGLVASPPEGPKVQTLVGGQARGSLIGGNLCLITALLGTPWEVETKGRILLIEEVEEEPYRIDRMLVQLRLAGKLDEAAGIIFAYSPSCGDEDELLRFLRDQLPQHVPAIYGFPAGHDKLRASLPFGVAAVLDADQGTLTFEEPACYY